MKSKGCVNNPHSLEELKYNIQHEIVTTLENELRQVAGHVFRRCEACQIAQGHHFENEL